MELENDCNRHEPRGKLMQLLLFLRSLLPHVISYESPQRKYSVMRVRDWRAQDKMERAAGHETNTGSVMTDWFTCDLCRIGIGPNHCQQEVYLYPVYDQKAKLHGEGLGYVASDILHICGECASWKSRDLPEWLCCIGPWAWETDRLSDYYQTRSRREAAVVHVEVCEWLLVFVYCIAWNVSIHDIWKIVIQEEREQHRMIGPRTKKEKEDRSNIFTRIEDPGFKIAH
jgi:hypothetical protein